MAIKQILLRGGSTVQHEAFRGLAREVTVDTTKRTLVVHDAVTSGGFPVAKAEAVATKLSQLTGLTDELWTRETLTRMSELEDDTGYAKGITKISQLANDKNFKTAHCSYCSYCTYCGRCSRCNQVQCTEVKCTETRCSVIACSFVPNCANCDCDCGDDEF